MNIEIEELRAWVDGELDPQRALAVKAAVDRDPELNDLAAKLRASQLQYKQAFEQVAMTEIPASLQHKVESLQSSAHAVSSRSFIPATAIAASVLLAAMAGYLAGSKPENSNESNSAATIADSAGLARTVAAYQSLYVRDTVANIKNGIDKLPALSAQLSAATDLKIQIPDLQAQGYTFVRAQQLAFDGSPLVQLIYLAPEGLPLALCFMREEGTETSVKLGRHFELSTAEWRLRNTRFVMVSDADEGMMTQLYEATKDQWKS